MNDERFLVLLVQDMVLFPNSEVRIECDDSVDREILSLAEESKNKEILLINPINDLKDITSFPNIGVVGEIKLKLDVPNGKTRIVLSGKEE